MNNLNCNKLLAIIRIDPKFLDCSDYCHQSLIKKRELLKT